MSVDVSLLPPRYQKQIAEQLGGPVVGVAKTDPKPAPDGRGHIVEIAVASSALAKTAKRPRLKQDRAGLNKTEAAFREYLLETKPNCNPRREGTGFRTGNGCVYWPDFVIGAGPEHLEAYEVKGYMEDDAAAKLKSAARMFPEVTFFLVTKRKKAAGGGWEIEEVLP